MSTHRFRIVNVFTHPQGPLTGNSLCVFEDGSSFDSKTMQALACQFNLSETTFILPSSQAAARVRIFTPSYEMPFAGHPTLGTAHVCRAIELGGDSLQLEMQAGLIAVDARQDRWTLTAPNPTWREVDVPRAALASALGLEAHEIGKRPMWVKSGKEQLIIPLTSQDAVRRAAPCRSRVRSRTSAMMTASPWPMCSPEAMERCRPLHKTSGALWFTCWRASSSRKMVRCSRIRQPAPRLPISAPGVSQRAAACRCGCRLPRVKAWPVRPNFIWRSAPIAKSASEAM